MVAEPCPAQVRPACCPSPASPVRGSRQRRRNRFQSGFLICQEGAGRVLRAHRTLPDGGTSFVARLPGRPTPIPRRTGIRLGSTLKGLRSWWLPSQRLWGQMGRQAPRPCVCRPESTRAPLRGDQRPGSDLGPWAPGLRPHMLKPSWEGALSASLGVACLARQRASLSPGFRPGYPGSPSLKVAPSGRSPESLIPAALQPRPQAVRGEAPTRCGSLRTAVWHPKEWTRRLGHPDTLQSSALQGSPEPLLQAPRALPPGRPLPRGGHASRGPSMGRDDHVLVLPRPPPSRATCRGRDRAPQLLC